jgi:hypothetical protein
MEILNNNDLDIILESLKHTKLKFENYPIGEKGYPSYEYKQSQLEKVNTLIQKIKAIKSSESM